MKEGSESTPDKLSGHIISKVEKIIQGTQAEETEESVLKFSPEEQAEQLWSLYCEHQRAFFEFLKEARQKPRAERGTLEELKAQFDQRPEIQKTRELISQRWRNPQVQSLFRHHLSEEIKAKTTFEPSLASYRAEKDRLSELAKERNDILARLYETRGTGRSELDQIRLAEIDATEKNLQEKLQEIFQNPQNAEVASRIQYETLKEYHHQYQNTEFIWFPSRMRIYQQIRDRLINSSIMPLFINGETGTGKSAFY